MKKLLSVLLAISLVMSLGMFASAADDSVNFIDAVDDTQGPVWYYLADAGDGFQELNLHSAWGTNWQFSTDPSGDDVYYSVYDWNGWFAGAGMWNDTNVKIAVGWKAPSGGTATIGEWDYNVFYEGESGVETDTPIAGGKISVMHGTTVLFSATTTATASDNIYTGEGVEVAAGDMIYFVLDGSDDSDIKVSLETVSVEFDSDGVPVETPTPVETPADETEPGDVLPIAMVVISAITAGGALIARKRR